MSFTTAASIQQKVSADGYSLRLDDSGADIQDVLDEADSEINLHCALFYSATELANSDWIEKQARAIAVFLLCERRLNAVPAPAKRAYDKAVVDLERVRVGALTIPDARPNKGTIPVVSVPRPYLRPHPRTVIEKGRSTGTPEGYTQKRDPAEIPFDTYSI
jgi:hypothetical protein